MLENLSFIEEKGIDAFLKKEKKKWVCPQCGRLVTCHGGMCLTCGFEKFKN
jgi:rubrerythrin